MKYSENYKLNKPDMEDQFNLEHWNENTDKIDARMRKSQDEIESNDRDIATLFDESSKTNDNVAAIDAKIPAQASADNPLVDKAAMNSSIATNTANFIGTFASVNALNAYSGKLTNNDYAFVKTTDAAGNTIFSRYKWSGTAWLYEYELNNSSFTAAQWAAVNSGATSTLISQIKTMGGASASADGSAGFVTQPKKGDQNKVLCGDGNWKDVSSANGAVTLQAAFNAAHPVGETYTQYPQMDDPETLYNKNGVTSKWEVVDYKGAFFRAQGGNADTFKSKWDVLSLQSESLPNITGNAAVQGFNNNNTYTGAFDVSTTVIGKKDSGTGTGNYGGLDFDASRSNSAYGKRNEVAPANYTIRIWKRTA